MTHLYCLHGVGGDGQSFANMVAQLPPQWHTHCWNFPGYAGTPALLDWSWDKLAERLHQDILANTNAPVVLLGHSIGGMLAQWYARCYPNSVQALILCATSPAFGRNDGDFQKRFIQQRLAPLDQGLSLASLAPGMVEELAHPSATAATRKQAIQCMEKVPEATYRQAMQCITTFDMRPYLPRLSMPKLLIAGDQDSNAPSAMMQRFADKLPAPCTFIELAQCGHLLPIEQPQTLSQAVVDFLG